MALWGKKDQIVFNTDIAVVQNDATVTTAGDFTDANDNLVKAGDLLRISGVDYRVAYVTSATSLELTIPYAGSNATISAANVIRRPIPKYWLQGQDSVTQDIYFVDNTEASLAANKNRGLNSPGWWQYHEYTDASGATRYKTELLVAFSETAANAGDYADDTDVADSAVTITVSGQPTNQSTDDAVGEATFSVTASVGSGSLIYQWQLQTATGTRWTNVTGATSSSLALTGLTTADTGKKYRVKITSTSGAAEVTSDTATLTVTAA
jgi:hypothetical protein